MDDYPAITHLRKVSNVDDARVIIGENKVTACIGRTIEGKIDTRLTIANIVRR